MSEALQAEIAGLEKASFLSGAQIEELAKKSGLGAREVMLDLLAHDIWPERFARNRQILSTENMRRLLAMRVFIAGCGGLGGAVAAMLARTGIGMFRLCDHGDFEESNLNRQMFCTEKTLGKPKVLVVRSALLEIASYLEIEILADKATAENLPSNLSSMDVLVDCLDSIAGKKMLEEAAQKAGIAYVHGGVTANEGLVWMDSPAQGRLASLYPPDATHRAYDTLAPTVNGTAALMCSLLIRGRWKHSSMLHLDLSVPELEAFR